MVRSARIRRLLADLRRPESRGDALRRVRRRVISELRRRARRLTRRNVSRGTAPRTPKPASVKRPDSWYVGEWSRLATAVFGAVPGSPPGDEGSSPDPSLARAAVTDAQRHRAQAAFTARLEQGEPLETAVYDAVAALCEALEWHGAWALAEGVRRLPGGEIASAVGHAVLLHRRRQFDRVWRAVEHLDDAVLAAHIAVEAVDGALATGTDATRRRALAIAAPRAGMSRDTLMDLAARLLAFGEREGAAASLAALRTRDLGGLDERRRHVLGLADGWLAPEAPSIPPGAIPVGVLDYRSPDHVLTSGNAGDYIQTLSMLGNLTRLTDVTFSGADGLGEVATELQARIRPPLRVPGVRGAVHLVAVDRDFSSGTEIPPGTWMVAFGWHMHPLFELRYDFPFHPNIRPLFLSFHVNRLEMLSADAQAYLRRYAPIGCRDWNTVYLLLSAGIDAFFSGCLTTTVDALFPSRKKVYGGGGPVGVIDLPLRSAGQAAESVRMFSHQSDQYRLMPLADALRAASSLLGDYQQHLHRVVTGRLHAYLPLTSLGVPVDFKTSSPGDIRFAGLIGLRSDDDALEEMRGGLRELLAKAFDRILGGASEAEVYALWRDLTHDRVAEARARFEAPAVDPPTTIDIAAAVATSRAGSRRFGPHAAVDDASVTDIVLCFDQNLMEPAAVLLESIVGNASGPLRLWVLGRGLTDDYQEWLARVFPALPMTFLPCDQVTYGAAGRPRRLTKRITISTMDRLLLPHMLDGVDRVVYLDVDTLMLDDVCRLARTDLGGLAFAARDSNVSEASEWQRAGRRLPEAQATELRRRMARLHGYGHAALNAGVLVLDLERMRRDDFTARYLALVEEYGLHDQDVMLAYAGPDRRVLDARWNTMPALEDVDDPALIHWASLGKPWESRLTFAQARWRAYEARVHERTGRFVRR